MLKAMILGCVRIAEVLNKIRQILLDGYLLQDVAETMKTIWQGQEEYEKYRLN